MKSSKLLGRSLFLALIALCCMDKEFVGAEDAAMVWSQPQGTEYPVFYSKQDDGQWSEPVQLTNNYRMNVVPALTSDQHGNSWVVWTTLEGVNSYLYYKKYNGVSWSEECKINTGLSSNTAPSVAVDNNGVLWLAWAGFDGQDDEIFYASWSGSAFTPPARITDNQTPDILPVLEFDIGKGALSVQWSGYNGNQYQTYCSQYNGENGWDDPSPALAIAADTSQHDSGLVTRNEAASDSLSEEALEVELPDFVQSLPSVSIHVRGMSIQSIPSRMMRLEKK